MNDYAADIPFALAERAHAGTSFVPERRAASAVTEYCDHLDAVLDQLQQRAAGPERQTDALAKFERYRSYYCQLTKAYLGSRDGAMSTMITGGSGFQARRMEKKWDRVDGHVQRLNSQPARYGRAH